MITTLMFHRVYARNLPETDRFDAFLQLLKSMGTACLPGQSIPEKTHGICMTFDDAYFDFYHHVFPLLKHHQLPAVLAIPTALIAEQVDMEPKERLQLQFTSPLNHQIHNNPSLCSWQEIKEMVDSGWVMPASHGARHIALSECSNWQQEIIQSKQALEKRLNHPVDIFVYPYGRFDKATHQFVCQHYRYAMRIGGATNFNWRHPKQLIYRINADKYWPNQKNPFNFYHQLIFTLRALSNTLRGR